MGVATLSETPTYIGEAQVSYQWQQAKAVYAELLELCNNLETDAHKRPGVSGAVLRDWLAGEPVPPGSVTHLNPQDAALGQAVQQARRLAQSSALLLAQVKNAYGLHTGV
jgi:hypothetical protein